ncbi:DUF2474 domain-containing protein [Methylobacillus rhizosphaerae]|nr:DUF2474 domain-containing protein [Methylobacillus rhizosphaerae]
MATTETSRHCPAWLKRLGWLCLIWSASVLAMLIAAYLMRLFMQMIGLHA